MFQAKLEKQRQAQEDKIRQRDEARRDQAEENMHNTRYGFNFEL